MTEIKSIKSIVVIVLGFSAYFGSMAAFGQSCPASGHEGLIIPHEFVIGPFPPSQVLSLPGIPLVGTVWDDVVDKYAMTEILEGGELIGGVYIWADRIDNPHFYALNTPGYCIGDVQDLDGISDDWEIANGLDPSNPNDALEDDDQDGADNLTEFIAGTNPQDPTSFPEGHIPPPPSEPPSVTGYAEFGGCNGNYGQFLNTWWELQNSAPTDFFEVQRKSGSYWSAYFMGNSSCVFFTSSAAVTYFRVQGTNIAGPSPWVYYTAYHSCYGGGGGPVQ